MDRRLRRPTGNRQRREGTPMDQACHGTLSARWHWSALPEDTQDSVRGRGVPMATCVGVRASVFGAFWGGQHPPGASGEGLT